MGISIGNKGKLAVLSKGNLRSFVEYENPQSIGSRLRKRRLRLLSNLIDSAALRGGRNISILDIGGRRHYWDLFEHDYLASRRVHITIVNLPSETILDSSCDHMTIVTGNGCNLKEYADNSFDMVHSNSTIEHVGSWSNMKRFAVEVRRLAPSYYIQTPYFWFPIEPHYLMPFIHWLPEDFRAWLLTKTSLGNYPRFHTVEEALTAVRDAKLLDMRQFGLLFSDAMIHYEYLGPLPKSLIAVRSPSSERVSS